MSQRQSVTILLPMFMVCALFSIGAIIKTVWMFITKGRKVFYYKTRDERPRILDDALYGNHGFARLKNVTLHYVANGTVDKPLMLLLHGFPESWYSWRYQLKEFQQDFRVVAVDMRGCGESSKPNHISDYAINCLVQDIKELIPALGFDKCVLVGHDWGGAVTWAFSQMYPDLVQCAIVFNCPHPKAFRKCLITSQEQRYKSWYMSLFQCPWLPEMLFAMEDYLMVNKVYQSRRSGAKKGTFTDDDIEAIKYTLSQPGSITGELNYIRANLRYKDTLPYPHLQVQVPLLMLWGTKDAFLCTQLALLSKSFAQNYELQLVEGASHWVQQEEPKIVNKHMWAFFHKLDIVNTLKSVKSEE